MPAKIPNLMRFPPTHRHFRKPIKPLARKNSRKAGEIQNWHGSCNLPCMSPDGPVGPVKQGVITMSIAKFQNAAIALVGAVIVAAIFVGAALEPVVSLA
jgi:hypothetical protein